MNVGDIVRIRSHKSWYHNKIGKVERAQDNTIWIRFLDHTTPMVFACAEGEIVRKVGEVLTEPYVQEHDDEYNDLLDIMLLGGDS